MPPVHTSQPHYSWHPDHIDYAYVAIKYRGLILSYLVQERVGCELLVMTHCQV